MMTKAQDDTSPGPSSRSHSSKDSTIISERIRVEGDIAGQEDLTIQGRVEGIIELKNNHVTLGKTGHMIGDLYGKLLSIEGEVQGNLFAEEKIELLPSAVVHGNMQAPVIGLQKGAKFKGMIDMDTGNARQRSRLIPTSSPGSERP